MSAVRTNILANLAGQGWSAALQLLLVPLYVHFLGIDGYGIVGFYGVLITTVQIFDLGLAQTLNRELARRHAVPGQAAEMLDLVRTVEIVYWAIIAAVCGALLAFAPRFAAHAFHSQRLDAATITQAVAMMIAVIALQWPVTLYQSGMMGLQRQISANLLRVALSTLAGAGSVLTLWLAAPTVIAFFAWQIVAGIVALAATAYVFHAQLPPLERAARFRPDLLKGIWRFAAGMSGLTISAVVLTQMDKWMLTRLLTLEAFGYYTLAWTAANALGLFTAPIFSAVYPRFSTLVARDERAALFGLYHLATQAVSVTIIPLALLLALFAGEVLLLWTRQPAIACAAAPILCVLALGFLLNSLAHPPYAWELAHGRPRKFLIFNWCAIALAAPGIWYLARQYGGMGAATAWFCLNAAYLLVAIPWVHRPLPRAERMRWLAGDIAAPLLAATAVLVIGRWALPADLGTMELLAALVLMVLAAAAAALSAAPALCTVLVGALRKPGNGSK